MYPPDLGGGTGKNTPPAGSASPFGLRRAKVMFLPVPPPPLCTLTNKSTIKKYGTYDKQKRSTPFSKRLCPVCSMARFGIELIAKGRIPFSKRLRTPRSAIACRLFLVPMAHFGIESIAKKDGYPSQNDFALSVSMARFGIELIAKRTDTFLKTTSGPALAR